jgi:hypothetical protein
MYRDPRGGHNRKKVNECFFKTWSPQMAYVLGLIYADCAVEDVRQSSRTCYLQLSSVDKELLESVRTSLSSKHAISMRRSHSSLFFGKRYQCSDLFTLRIGNKLMYQDLVDKGLTPNKSKTMRFPEIPSEYLNFYIRGYFDGDGCVNVRILNGRRLPIIQVIFTSGSYEYLYVLMQNLRSAIDTSHMRIRKSHRAFRLRYRKGNCLKILSFMYTELDKAPYLARKYEKYRGYIEEYDNISR